MTDDLGKLVLRLVLGLLILLHGISKVISGIDPVVGMLAKAGLPPVLAYGVYIGEVVAPLLLIAGLWTRAAALVVMVNMMFALALAHTGDFAKLSKTGGWALELQAFYFFVALALLLMGAGRYSVGGSNGRFN